MSSASVIIGYEEILCRLCGVSFNIGRIRRPEDPPSEGWTSTGDGKGFVEGQLCEEEDGCQLVERRDDFANPQSRDPVIKSVGNYSFDDEEDSDYVDEEEVEDEEYDFESDDDLVEDSGEASSDERMEGDSHDQHIRYLRGEVDSGDFQDILGNDDEGKNTNGFC